MIHTIKKEYISDKIDLNKSHKINYFLVLINKGEYYSDFKKNYISDK